MKKTTAQLKTATPLILVALALACFGFLPQAQAVVPAPDGGYSGGNTAEGQNALLSFTSGGFNTAVGFFSLRSDTAGSFNTAIGAGALLANTANENTATGAGALFTNTSGHFNTANGALALFSNTTASFNNAVGVGALQINQSGQSNNAFGYIALSLNVSGTNNTAVGDGALASSTGNLNTALGAGAGFNVATANNVICLGAGLAGADVSNTCFIGNIRGVTTQNADAIPVLIDDAGQLGTASSSRRYKKEIKLMNEASEAILALKPVTFHYKSDKTNRPEFGLIAEQVAEVNPDLVVRDKNGEIYTVRYDAVNAMLLNEFLKEHKKVEDQARGMREQGTTIAELKSTIAQQQKGMETLAASLKEQAEQIQKVTAQLETSKPVRQMALNNP